MALSKTISYWVFKGFLGVLVIGVVLYLVRDPFYHWQVERVLQNYSDAAFGAPLKYRELSMERGEVRLNGVEVGASQAGYTLRVPEVICRISSNALGFIQLETCELWAPEVRMCAFSAPPPLFGEGVCTVHKGQIFWEEDPFIRAEISGSKEQGELLFSSGGRVCWDQGQLLFSQVPCPALFKLLPAISPHWSHWVATAGEVNGSLSRNLQEGRLSLNGLAVNHCSLPLTLAFSEGEICPGDEDGLTFSSSIEMDIQAAQPRSLTFAPYQLLLDPSEAHAWRVKAETDLKDLWRLLERRLELEEHTKVFLDFKVEELAEGARIVGKLKVKEEPEEVAFELETKKASPLQGWLKGKGLALSRFLSPLGGRFRHAQWTGIGDLEGEFNGDEVAFALDFEQLALENESYRIELEEIEEPVRLWTTLSKGIKKASLPLKRGSFLDKASGVQLVELSAQVESNGEDLLFQDLEAYYLGLRFTGEGTYAPTGPEETKLSLHADSVTGKLSQLQTLMAALRANSFLQGVPIEGDIELGKKGGDLTCFNRRGGKRELSVDAEGKLLDGKLLVKVANLAFQDLAASFAYSYPHQKLELSDVQGSVFVLSSSEKGEEYQLAGDRIVFLEQGNPHISFDMWIGDRRRDLLRLVGKTQIDHRGAPCFEFDERLTHFGSIYPNLLTLRLKDWGEVDSFGIAFDLDCATALHDIRRLLRTGLVSLDPPLLAHIQAIKSSQGLCKFQCSYQKGKCQFSLTSDQLIFNQHTWNSCILKGAIERNIWCIDQLSVGDLSLSAELEQHFDRWRIHFLGLRDKSRLLAGLEGWYDAKHAFLEAKIHLLEADLSALSQLPIKGRWKGKGTLFMDLSKAPHDYPAQAHLQGALCHMAFNGRPLEDALQVTCDLSLGGEKTPLRLWLKGGPAEEMVLTADAHDLKLEAQFSYCQQPLFAVFHTNWRTGSTGKLILSETYPVNSNALNIFFEQRPYLGFVPARAEGTLFGLDIDLERDLREAPAQETIFATGQVGVDFFKLRALLPAEFAHLSEFWSLGKGYRLQGAFQLRGLLPETCTFRGEFTGENFEVAGQRFASLKSQAEWTPTGLLFERIVVNDPAGELKIDELFMKQKRGEPWHFLLKNVEARNLEADQFHFYKAKNKSTGLCFEKLSSPLMTGYIGDCSTIQGEGCLDFIVKEPQGGGGKNYLALLSSSKWLMPTTGHLEWKVGDNKWRITSLSDTYSEGKLFKFTLPKINPQAVGDLEGNLEMVIRVRPTRPLLRLTDRSLVSIRGTIWKPEISLLEE